MSRDTETLKTLASNLDVMPGNPHRGGGGGGAGGGHEAVHVMERSPSMARPAQAGSQEQSIAQLLCKYAEDIAVFIEHEADRRLAAARADCEKMHQFADSVRRNGIGNL